MAVFISKINSKSDLFNKNIYANKRLIRKGVLKIFEYARDKKINLGLVSTTTKKNIDILFKILEGQIEKRTLVSLVIKI